MPDVLNATVQAIPKDGSRTFLETDGSAVPVEVLVHPINSAHDLVVVFDQEWLASRYSSDLEHHLVFWNG